jgi:signal peptidase
LNINRADFLELSREILGRGALLRFRAHGNSMHPFIESGDILVVEPIAQNSANEGDVIFYRRFDGALTAHRLIKVGRVKDSTVLMTKGDSLDYFDPPLRPEQVLGRVITVERDGHFIRQDSGVNRVVHRTWARISPMSWWLRPLVRPVWRLVRNLSPAATFRLCMRTLQGMPVYRRAAVLFRPSIEIGEAVEEDVRKVHAWLNPNQPELPTSPDISCTCFVAKRDSRVVGSVELVRRPEKYHPYDGYWLSSLRVRTAYRGMGIGEELSRSVMAKGREERAEVLSLMVSEDNHQAIKLYQKLGFQLKVIPTLEELFEKERHTLGYRNVIMYVSLDEGGLEDGA